MRRSLFVLTLGLLLATLQPALACSGCAPAHDCCEPGKPMPCGQQHGSQGMASETRMCCSPAPIAAAAIASFNKPDTDIGQHPALEGADAHTAGAAMDAAAISQRTRPPAFLSFVPGARNTETYLLTGRLRL